MIGLKARLLNVDTIRKVLLAGPRRAGSHARRGLADLGREGTMGGRSLSMLVVLPLLAGCQTHVNLRNNSVKTAGTLADLNYQQVLDNVAQFTANPSAMPSIAVINAGTVTVADQKTANVNATGAPTISNAQQAGSGLPILSLLLNPSVSRTL